MAMTLNDEAIEAFFLGEGHPAWEQDEALASLVDGVLMAAAGPPPRPGAALAGFLGQATPAEATTEEVATQEVRPPAPWQPRAAATTRQRDNVVPLLRRLRLAAGVAIGAGVAAASVTVAAATGVLPDPAIRAVSWVVEAVTPFELHEPARTVPAPDAPPQATTPTAPTGPLTGSGPNGEAVIPGQPAVTAPGRPPVSIPGGGPGPVQPPGTGVDRPGQSPGTSVIPPIVPGPPADVSPPLTAGPGTPPTTRVGGPTQIPGGGSIPPPAGPRR